MARFFAPIDATEMLSSSVTVVLLRYTFRHIDSTVPKVSHNLVRPFAGFMVIERVEHVRPDSKVHDVIHIHWLVSLYLLM